MDNQKEQNKYDKLIKQQSEMIENLQSKIMEYCRVERVIVAAGLISQEKFDQARELIQSLREK